MYGPTIRKIRLEKKIRANEVYLGVVSKSFYYNFEKGNNDITSDKFLLILDNLELSLAEFLYIHNDYKLLPNQSIYREILSLYKNLDTKSLEHLHTIYLNLKNSSSRTEQLYASLAYSLVYTTYNYKDETPTLPLKEYLSYVKTWTLFELEIFENSMAIFFKDRKTLDEMFAKAIATLETFKDILELNLHEHIRSLYLNYLQFLLDENEFYEASCLKDYFSEHFSTLPANTDLSLSYKFGCSIANAYSTRCLDKLSTAREVLDFLNEHNPTDERILHSIYTVHKDRLIFFLERNIN